MLDRFLTPILRSPLQRIARVLVRAGVGANTVTLAAFATGLIAAGLIAASAYGSGAIALVASRLLDGLDGAVARETQPTDAGGFLDIALDFVFYASIPLAFALASPATNALPAAALLASFVGSGSSFLAFAALAAKRGMDNLAYPDKSLYFLGGLTEATETLAFFVAMCLWPAHFDMLATTFAVLCAVTTATRIWWGWRAFS
ncbi:MAG: CDP-alcohol phosphatidyltransferase family protein [Rhodoferax sp.]|nr:CDP-alcohol phosphatidyltransferase family protein [Rhodoferax sp.]